MAAPHWPPDAALSVLGRLRARPYEFDFFQAVRLLTWLDPDRAEVGRTGPAKEEAVRLGSHVSLKFPPSQLVATLPPAFPGAPPRLTVAFLGLAGHRGALPEPFTVEVLQRLREGDSTAADFLDLFNHRLLSLFYRAWEKHHPVVAFERSLPGRWRPAPPPVDAPRPRESPRGTDDDAPAPPARYLLDLIGLGLPRQRERAGRDLRTYLYYAGLFAQQRRTAGGLEQILADHFGVPVSVHQFQGRWLQIAPEDQSSLGLGGRHNGLGRDLVVGTKVWDVQGKMRITLGPLPRARFLAFQPGTPAFESLARLTRLYVRQELDVELQVILRAADVPEFELGPGGMTRLGRVAWLRTRPAARDAGEAVFRIPMAP